MSNYLINKNILTANVNNYFFQRFPLNFPSLSRLSKGPVAQACDFAARTLLSRFAGGGG